MSEIPYTRPPIVDEIWQILRETQQIVREVSAQSKETDRKFQETDRKFQETDRKFQETERWLKEHTQETERLLKEQAKESEHKLQETERLMDKHTKEAARRSKELDKRIGDLGNRLGEFVEGMVAPGIKRLFQERGIVLRTVSRDVSSSDPALGLATQIDLFAIDGDCCVLIEVKSKCSIDDVNDHIERMGKFKRLFPEYADKKAYGAVAAMVMPEDVAKYAWRKGFFVIAQEGDAAVILNDAKFVPAAW